MPAGCPAPCTFDLVCHDAARLALARLYARPDCVGACPFLFHQQVGDRNEVVSTSCLKLAIVPDRFLVASSPHGEHPPTAPALSLLPTHPRPGRFVSFTWNPIEIPAPSSRYHWHVGWLVASGPLQPLLPAIEAGGNVRAQR
jgi:hypothetical protein